MNETKSNLAFSKGLEESSRLKILVACEFSGIVREALLAKGHDAWSCDLLDSEIPSKFHIRGNVLDILNESWEMMIGFPPCTFLCNSGVRWIHERLFERWPKMLDAVNFFKALLNAPIPKIALENPVMHKYASERIGIAYDQIIQPWEYGHSESKATCFWLKNLPPLMPTNIVIGYDFQKLEFLPKINERVFRANPGENRWMERSRTLPGVASAIANQWSFS